MATFHVKLSISVFLAQFACQEQLDLTTGGSSLLPNTDLLSSLPLLLCRALDFLITSPYSSQLNLGVPQEDPQLAS